MSNLLGTRSRARVFYWNGHWWVYFENQHNWDVLPFSVPSLNTYVSMSVAKLKVTLNLERNKQDTKYLT